MNSTDGRNRILPLLHPSPMILGNHFTTKPFPPSHSSLQQSRCPTPDAYDPSKVRHLLEILDRLTPAQENSGSWGIQIEARWRAWTLVLADLRLKVAKVPDHLWEKAKMASDSSFFYPCSWAVPSHTASELEHVIYFSQDQIDHKQKLERCLCTGACPLLLYLETMMKVFFWFCKLV